ncbi:MAG: DNA polymerase III subunit beta [Patescibacteria group bacterium]
MKIEILQENLNELIQSASRVVSGKGQLPVLNNVLLSAEKGQLRVTATNLETGINLWRGVKVIEDGKVTVPAKIFLEMVASLPKGVVKIETEAEKISVSCEGYKAKINGIAAEEFPEVPSLRQGKKEPEKGLMIKKDEFIKAVERVAIAAGTDEARPIFTGIKLEIGPDGVRMAATDGYRLSIKKIAGKSKEKGTMVIPAKALSEMAKAAGQENGEEVGLVAAEAEKQLIMSIGGVEVVTRLLEGEFPDFDKIVPTVKGTSVIMETEELKQAVRAAAVFAKDSANIVKFKIGKKEISISANAPQVGENEVKMEGEIDGEEVEIAFNSRYLMEMLGVIKEEKIRMEATGPLSPGVFKAAKGEDWLQIIMPVRVQG